jgi:hypothetical protein
MGQWTLFLSSWDSTDVPNQILIIEGLVTILCGIGATFLIPNSVDTASFLTPVEREHSRARLEVSNNVTGFATEPETFRWLKCQGYYLAAALVKLHHLLYHLLRPLFLRSIFAIHHSIFGLLWCFNPILNFSPSPF